MNYLTEQNLASALESLIVEAARGLRAARDRGVIVHNPKTIDIDFLYLVEANAIVDQTSSTSSEPEIVTDETRTTPATTETSTEIREAIEEITVQEQGGVTRTEIYTPPTQETRTDRGGGDEVESTDDFEYN